MVKCRLIRTCNYYICTHNRLTDKAAADRARQKAIGEHQREVQADITNFKAALRRMAKASGNCGVVFFETANKFSKRPHASIEAVFVSQDIEADASIYYKQAMMEAAEECDSQEAVLADDKSSFGMLVLQCHMRHALRPC
eukprot:17406-Heterococcus_DN1.PRE.1